jgi:endonuclease-3
VSLRDCVQAVTQALEKTFGAPEWRRHEDPLDGLIRTILSQNTNDRNRDRAYAGLKNRFPTWEDLLEAEAAAVKEAIRVGGLAEIKSQRILHILKELRSSPNGLTLRPLGDLPPEEAEQRLLSFPGVGKKTARCVLLFELNKPMFPVDTHIMRVVKRLGWIPKKASADRAHDILQDVVPGKAMAGLHLNLIRLGREICRPRTPRCPDCPIRPWCDYVDGEQAGTCEVSN